MIKCKYCKRELPNKNLIIKLRCKWCEESPHTDLLIRKKAVYKP